MKVDIYMPLFIGDYLRDTADLTAEEHGAYLLILMAMWTSGGGLPVSRLDRIARIPADRWTIVWKTIGRFFEVDGETAHQGRLGRELQDAQARRETARQNGLLGGRPRNLPVNRPVNQRGNPKPNPGKTSSPSPSESPSEPPPIEEQIGAGAPACPPEFEELWKGCDRKGHKADALKAWRKVRPPSSVVVPAWKRYVGSLEEWRQPRDVATWLNAKGWLETYVPYQKPNGANGHAKPAPESFASRDARERAAARESTQSEIDEMVKATERKGGRCARHLYRQTWGNCTPRCPEWNGKAEPDEAG